jgi:hypothetical protein
MGKSKLKLTGELLDAICQRLKAGAFERVAVESLGVSWSAYRDWQDRAKRRHCPSIYRLLAADVVQARAHARFMAEMTVCKEDPKFWLVQGPGRDRATQEGWGTGAKSAAGAEHPQDSSILWELFELLLTALAPYPEPRAAAAAVIDNFFAKRQPVSSHLSPTPQEPHQWTFANSSTIRTP